MTNRELPSGSPPLDFLRQFLRSAEIHLRFWNLLQTGLWAAGLGCVVVLLGIGADTLRDVWAFTPPVFAGLAVCLAVWALGSLLWKGFRRIPSEQVAFLIEQRHPDLNNSLISSVQLTRQGLPGEGERASGLSSSLVDALLRRTAEAVRSIPAGEAVERSQIRRSGQFAATLAVLTLMVAFFRPGLLSESWKLLIHPIDSMPLRAIFIQTQPASGKILLGRPVTLTATTSGRRTKTLQVEIRPEQGKPQTLKMTPVVPADGEKREFTYRTPPVRGSFSYRAFVGGATSEPQRLEAVPPPAVGEMQAVYTYPQYTRLKREVRKGSGYVRALMGTEVTLSLKTNKPVESGRLVFQSGAEVPLDVANPQNLRGRFIVLSKDSYRIVLRDRWGFENPDPVRYAIDVAPDRIPAIEMLAPKGELTVNGGETIGIQYLARDDFGIEDIRLVLHSTVGASARKAGAEGQGGRREVLISKIDGTKRWESGRYEWDLRDLGLGPGSIVTARLAVRDNDAISGPKKGFSKPVRIRVRSPEEEHQRVKGLQKNLADRILNLLGDQLELEADASEKLGESPDGLDRRENSAKMRPTFSMEDRRALSRTSERIEEDIRNLISEIDRVMSRTARDQQSGYDSFADLNALRSNLFYLQREMMPQARKPLEGATSPLIQSGTEPSPPARGSSPSAEENRRVESLERFRDAQKNVTRELERMAVFADDIGKRSQMRDLARLGRQLASAQNRMLDAFDRAKDGDPAARKALEETLAKLQDLLNKLSQGLRNLPLQLPEEFMNMPTNQSLNMSDISRRLQEIQRRMRQGDMKGARRLAEQMVKSLSQMIAALQGAMQQAMNQSTNRFGRSVQRQQSILQELLARQRALLDKTRKIESPMMEKYRALQRQTFERVEGEASRALQELRRLGKEVEDLPMPLFPADEFPGEKEGEALERSLNRRELKDAVKTADALGGLARKAAEAVRHLKEEEAPPGESPVVKGYRKLGDNFDKLREGLNQLPSDPRVVLTPEQKSQLAELKEEQDRVEAKTVEIGEKVEQIMKILPFLSPEIAKNLKNAGDAMSGSSKELGEQRADKAVPHERDAIYWLSRAGNNMRSAMQQMARRGRFGGASAPSIVQPGGRPSVALQWRPSVGEQEGGRTGASNRDFRLPDKDAYKVPKVYREEVVDALKGKFPPAYRDQIEQYFKNLVE